MRTWGRNPQTGEWVKVTTDANGFNDAVWITTLVQCLKLSPGESPFFANYGIPAQQSVITQVFPDYYVSQTQAQFSGYFSSLIVSKVNSPSPAYKLNLTTQQGVTLTETIPV